MSPTECVNSNCNKIVYVPKNLTYIQLICSDCQEKNDKKNELKIYFPKLEDLFKDMDQALEKIKVSHEKSKINSLLSDNDIKNIE